MKEGNNLATLEEEFVEPYEFLGEIQEGFRDVYVFLERNREKISEIGGKRLYSGTGAGFDDYVP